MSIFDKLTAAVMNPSAISKAQVPGAIAQARKAMETDPPGAAKLLQFAVNNDPANVEAWSLLAQALSNADRSADAEQAYRKWKELQPESPDPYLGIGTELLTQEQPEKAEPHLMHGLLLSTEQNAIDLYNLGLCLFQQVREAEAIPFCKRSYERSPDSETAVLLADCLYAKDRYEEAADYYGKGFAADPENLHAVESLGFTLELLGRPQEAIDALKDAVEKGTEDADVYGSLSRCYEALGESAKAQEAAAKYFELTPAPAEEAESGPTDSDPNA